MADVIFEIKYSNGLFLTALPESAVNITATSLTLYGRGATEYGKGLQQNLVSILENFAHSSPPRYPMVGQCWYNTQYDSLNVFNGVSWVSLVGVYDASLAQLIPGEIPIIDVDNKVRYKTISGDLSLDTDGTMTITKNSTFTLTGAVAGTVEQVGKGNVNISTNFSPGAVDLASLDNDIRTGSVSGRLENIVTGNRKFIWLKLPYSVIVKQISVFSPAGTSSMSFEFNNTFSNGDTVSTKTYTSFSNANIVPDTINIVTVSHTLAQNQGVSINFTSVTGTMDELYYTLVFERV